MIRKVIVWSLDGMLFLQILHNIMAARLPEQTWKMGEKYDMVPTGSGEYTVYLSVSDSIFEDDTTRCISCRAQVWRTSRWFIPILIQTGMEQISIVFMTINYSWPSNRWMWSEYMIFRKVILPSKGILALLILSGFIRSKMILCISARRVLRLPGARDV